ncbi:hypothetical protein [Clostridium sp. ZBS18]|nr:hypothetical protein [Clostridium sp. ZBS18]
MGFLGFESKAEKKLRLLKLDMENETKRKEAQEKGLYFFGTRYEDDYRNK